MKQALRLVPPAVTRVRRQPRQLGVVDQVREACKAKNRLAAALGAVIGGFVPVGSYVLSHSETTDAPIYTQVVAYFVFGLLVFSARSVYAMGRSAFGECTKAVGFTVGVEGIMIVSKTPALSMSALAILVGINAVSVACNLATRQPQPARQA